MCRGYEILAEIQQKRALKCTANTSCWCMKLETRLPHFDDVCLSPAEILEEHESLLTPNDIDYLDTLSTREFLSS